MNVQEIRKQSLIRHKGQYRKKVEKKGRKVMTKGEGQGEEEKRRQKKKRGLNKVFKIIWILIKTWWPYYRQYGKDAIALKSSKKKYWPALIYTVHFFLHFFQVHFGRG